MNREIKFRAWDNENEYMISSKQGTYTALRNVMNIVRQDDGYYNNGDLLKPNKEKHILMQYTGLKDKNGKEIYEGDIVTGTRYPFIENGKQNYIGIVVFYEDVAQFGYEYKCINKDKRGISNGINNEFQANENLICEDLEVIGNIYENSDLLKD